MSRKITLSVLDTVGVIMTACAALSGVAAFVFGGGRAAFDDPTIIWFAPLFFTPLALLGVGMILLSALVSKKRRTLVGWSVTAFGVLFAATAAVFNLTGLSSGETALEGTFWGTTAIIVSVIYALSMLVVSGVGGVVAKDILGMEPFHKSAIPAH